MSEAGTRPPAVAGQFYPERAESLSALVSSLLAGAPEGTEVPRALLVPHAGLDFSGEAAARAYKRVPVGSFDSVVIVGTGHKKAVEGAAVYPGDYAAGPFRLAHDAQLAAELRKATPLIVDDPQAHEREHSVEVQIPFLAKRFGKIKGVALVMNTQDLEAAREIGRALAAAAGRRKLLLIASSDLSHYPEGSVADRADKSTLEALAGVDPAYFWLANRFLLNRGLPDLHVTYCGEGAVTAVIEAARSLGAGSVKLLARLNSGDVVSEREYNHVVGYASAAFFPGPAPAKPLRLNALEGRQLLAFARDKAAEFLHKGKSRSPELSARPRFNLPAAVFVTLTKGGQLRGCVGTTEAQETLIEAVARHAAGVLSDERYKPLAASELKEARFEVTVLTPPKPATLEEIKPGDGVVLELDGKDGVFLPAVWEKVPEKTVFLGELCAQKLGLKPECYKDSGARYKVFSVDSFKEP